jgi:hypothetical protein
MRRPAVACDGTRENEYYSFTQGGWLKTRILRYSGRARCHAWWIHMSSMLLQRKIGTPTVLTETPHCLDKCNSYGRIRPPSVSPATRPRRQSDANAVGRGLLSPYR